MVVLAFIPVGLLASVSLETFLRVAGDDFFLLVVVEVNKVVAVACDAYEQAAVILRVCLRIAKGAFVDYVELDMVSA